MSKRIKFELLREACAIIDGIPARHLDLKLVVNEQALARKFDRSCGALGCSIGWITLHPEFQRRFRVSPMDGWSISIRGRSHQTYTDVANVMFGLDYEEARSLFAPRNCSSLDAPGSKASDKAMFKNRVRKFFAQHGQAVNPRY